MLSLEDRLEINDLYAAYAYAFDSNKAQEWAELFTPGGVFRLENFGEIVGRDALAEFASSRNESAPNVSHHTTNVIAEATSTGADGKAYVLALRLDGKTIRVRNLGGYVDKLEKVDGRWRFALRHFSSWLEPELVDAPIVSW
jgi:predicted ester cyclase